MPTMPGGGDAQAATDTLALLLQADQELRRRAMAVPSTAPAVDATTAAALSSAPGPMAVGPLAGKERVVVLPGVTTARVGLLPGLRTPAMLKFNGVSR